MNYTWLGCVAIVFLAIACIQGYRRGFVKEAVSVILMFCSLTLVWVVNPYVNSFLKENTSVYESVQESCRNLVESKLQESSSEQSDVRESLLDNLALPETMKNNLKENNTVETYQSLAVTSFTDYVSNYLALTVTNGLSFLLSYLLVTILVRTIVYALNLIAKLPILRGVNRIAGVAVGLVKGVLIVWIVLLAVTLLCSTQFGTEAMTLIRKDTFLSFMYDHDVFIKIFTGIFYGNA
jgi:uncharacterized membrane protein required for colicin V production